MDLTKLFCDVDDFIQKNSSMKENKLTSGDKRKYKLRARKLCSSEVMTICIAFHQSGYRNFKTFYLNYVIKYLYRQFPSLISYTRFISVMKENMALLAAYLTSRFDGKTGISFIDSTPIQVCKPKRMSRNKVLHKNLNLQSAGFLASNCTS